MGNTELQKIILWCKWSFQRIARVGFWFKLRPYRLPNRFISELLLAIYRQTERSFKQFFNFGNDSSQALDLQLLFDFTEIGVPLWFTSSTFLAGNDFRYKNEFDEKGKQNYTTYMEVGYNIDAPFGVSVAPVLGVVLNNKAQYYSYADYDKPSFVNLGCKVSKEIKLSESVVIPIWLNYTYNAASAMENLQPLGHQFLVAGVSFSISK